MGKPKRHHLVPEFYLKRFANTKEQVAAFRRTTGEYVPSPMSVKNAAVESGFNDSIDENGSVIMLAEDRLADIDNVAARLFQRIDEDVYPTTPQDRVDLAFFLGLQSVRTKAFRQMFEELGDCIARMRFELILRSMSDDELRQFLTKAGRPPSADAIQELKELRGTDAIEHVRVVPRANNKALKEMMRAAIRVAVALFERPWTLVTSDERVFLTGDRPLALYRTAPRPLTLAGLGAEAADDIYFPVDPYRALIIGSGTGKGWSVTPARPEQIRQINSRVAMWCTEWIFHHPDDKPLEGIAISRRPPTMVINGIPMEPRRSIWNQLRKTFFDQNYERRLIDIQWEVDDVDGAPLQG